MPQSTPVAFDNKGIVQKKDPAQLAPGEFYQLENAWSQQEGALTARTGHQKLTPTQIGSPCVSLSKLNLGGADSANPRYLGAGTAIQRATPGGSYALTSVYSGLSAGQRWSAQQYNAGTAGTPSLFFATRGQTGNLANGAVRDNGSYATLQKWGVDPPPVPVQATLNVPNIVYLTVPGGAPPRFVPSVNSNGSGLKTVSSMGVGPGYIQITPTAGGTIHGVNGIYVGMVLGINDGVGGNEQVIVLAVNATSFYAVTALAHSAGNVTLGWFQEDFTTVNGTSLFFYNGFVIDASFNGSPDDGYESDDDFHIALLSTDVTNVTNIEIRVVPNYSGTGGAATDYYTFSIVPAAVMSAGSATSPAWYEVNIPKNTFKKVGNAGSGAFTWKNINEIDIIATATAAGAGQTIGTSSIYFIGGGGLNSSAAGTTLYDWLYTYRNPTTQAEGNPCPFMITPFIPPPVTNGTVNLLLTGTALAATIANGIGEISGPGSIKVYRRGGTFSDGLFRHVGYAQNVGAGAWSFNDNASDASLNTADILEFDNDPPVPSSLPIELTANILNFQPSGGGSNFSTSAQAQGGAATALTMAYPLVAIRLILSNLPTSFTASTIASVITVGSTVQVGFGVTFETCIISAIGYNGSNAYIEVYLQYNHSLTSADSSETIECDAILRGRCDLVHQDFDCLFLAGDANNPATLYQSKVGRPEAFPVVNLENNFAQQINVGSPSNPINGIASIGPGELVCLNLDNIYIVQVWAGQMQQPIKAPASRGLYAKWCWCRGDNRIWYLAYDGIYTWAGGEGQKVSNAIDYLFKKQTVNGLAPVDFTQAINFSFAYAENSLYVVIIDTTGKYRRLRYETLNNRWTIETVYAASTGTATYTIDNLFTEPDTGNLLVTVTKNSGGSFLWLCDFYSTTDGWTTLPTDGIPIQYTAWRYWPIADPSADYQINEVMLELANPADDVTLSLFYNYATSPTDTIAVTGGTLPARGRLFSTVGSAESGVVQYSIGLKLNGATGEAGLTAFYTWQWRNYEWSDAGYPGPKTFGWLNIQANTNGASVPMQLQIDGQTVFSFSITGTFWTRSNIITLPSNITGVQYRVVPAAGYSGTLQIYDIQPKFEKLPMPISHFDSLGQVFGYAGWKFIWQVWLDYASPVPVIFSIYRDGNVLFYQKTVPAHAQRAIERFYLPPSNLPAGGTQIQFNKSQMYQFLFDANDGSSGVQLYRDGSRIEVHNLDGDQRGGFEQKIIWEQIPLEA